MNSKGKATEPQAPETGVTDPVTGRELLALLEKALMAKVPRDGEMAGVADGLFAVAGALDRIAATLGRAAESHGRAADRIVRAIDRNTGIGSDFET
jgi:hypothetical protein